MQKLSDLVRNADPLEVCGPVAETKNDSVMMHELCSDLYEGLHSAILKADAQLKQARSLSPDPTPNAAGRRFQIFMFGTQGLRTWRYDMEREHGNRATEIINAFTVYMKRVFLNVSKNKRLQGLASCVDLHFEIIDVEYEAECENRAFIDGVRYGDEVPDALREAVDELLQRRSAHTFGSVAWGNSSCQGHIRGQTFSAKVCPRGPFEYCPL